MHHHFMIPSDSLHTATSFSSGMDVIKFTGFIIMHESRTELVIANLSRVGEKVLLPALT